jgi:hypothetical protein
MIVHALGGEAYLNFEGNEFGHPEVSPSIPFGLFHLTFYTHSGLTSREPGITARIITQGANGTSSTIHSFDTNI